MTTDGKPKEIQEGVWGNLTDACLEKHHLKTIRFFKQGKQLTFEFFKKPGPGFQLLLQFYWWGYNINGGIEVQDGKTIKLESSLYNPQEIWNTEINLMPNSPSPDTAIKRIAKIKITMALQTDNVRYKNIPETPFAGSKLETFKFCFEKEKSVSSEIKQNEQDENQIGTTFSPIKAVLIEDDAFKQGTNNVLMEKNEGLKRKREENSNVKKQSQTQTESNDYSRENVPWTTKGGFSESHPSEGKPANRAGQKIGTDLDSIKPALIEDDAFKQDTNNVLMAKIEELEKKIAENVNYDSIKAALIEDEAFKQDINKALVASIGGLGSNLAQQIKALKKEKKEFEEVIIAWVSASKNRMTQSELAIAKIEERIPEKPSTGTFNIYHEGMQRLFGMGKSASRQQEAEKIKERQENGKTAVDLLEKLLEQIPEKDQNLRHREKIESVKSEIAAFLLALCSPKKACAKLVENLFMAGENPGAVPEIEEDHPDVRHLIEAYEYEVSLTGKPYWKEYEDYKALLREIGESKGFFDEVFLRFVKNRLFDFNVHALAAIKKEMENADSHQDKERDILFRTLETVLMSFGGIEEIRWREKNVGPLGNEFFEVHGQADDPDEYIPGGTILNCHINGYRLNWADRKVLQRASVVTKRGVSSSGASG